MVVRSRMNVSKSMGSPFRPSATSSRARNTSWYFASRPRVFAVIRMSLTSVFLFLGSAYRANRLNSSSTCSRARTGFFTA